MLLQTPPGVLVLRSHAYSVLRRFLMRRKSVFSQCFAVCGWWSVIKFTICGCETCCRCVSSQHLSSTWRACYNLFWLVENGVRCIFELISGYPVLLCPIGKILFSPMHSCVCGLKFWVSKCSPFILFYKCVGPCICLRYVDVNEHIILKILLKRGRARITLGVYCKSRRKRPQSEGLLILG